jgi:xanthine dehydrogenase accessory factor
VLFAEELVVVRGGGDLGTGVVARLHRCGFPVVVLELAEPLTVRRTVALSSAVRDGEVEIEHVIGRRCDDLELAVDLARQGIVPVVVSPELPSIGQRAVVDSRLAKRNLGTTIDDAPLVVALGPGFTAGHDCHAVVETARGHHLGRVIWSGAAAENTGVPGVVGGKGAERVLRAPVAGIVDWGIEIGCVVAAGQLLGTVGGEVIAAPFAGVVRGLIAPGTVAPSGIKIGDIDPRANTPCDEISDKALAIGGGVVEAVFTWISARS